MTKPKTLQQFAESRADFYANAKHEPGRTMYLTGAQEMAVEIRRRLRKMHKLPQWDGGNVININDAIDATKWRGK